MKKPPLLHQKINRLWDNPRFVAVVTVLTALAVGAPVQAQTPEIDALRVRAEAGDAEAQNNLALRYDFGQGVPQDFVEAHKWFNLAAAQSSGEDRDGWVENRDVVAERMTPEQIAGANASPENGTSRTRSSRVEPAARQR